MTTPSKLSPRLFRLFSFSTLKDLLVREDEPPSQSQGLHWKPVLIVLSLLIPCLLLTVYHAQYGGFRGARG